jgi:hypothetical protein
VLQANAQFIVLLALVINRGDGNLSSEHRVGAHPLQFVAKDAPYIAAMILKGLQLQNSLMF